MEVLLVDDDEVFNYMNQAIVERVEPGSTTRIYNSGLEVLQFINSNEFKPDEKYIMLLDIRMPHMNGFEFLNSVSSLEINSLSNTFIYLLSSTLDERDLDKSRDNKLVKGFISKPLTVDRFREILWENQLL